MTDGMTDAMIRLVDKDRIRDVLLNYARGVDRRDWELVRSAFFEDARDDHADFKGVRDDFIAWLRKGHDVADFKKSTHLLVNSLIEFSSDTLAVVETYFIARLELGGAGGHRAMLGSGDTQNGSFIRVEVGGRYVDRFEKRDGQWRVAKRRTVFDTLYTQPMKEGEGALNPLWALGTRDRDDPVYAVRSEARLS